MMYTLPKLPYAYDALEPYIDMQTMKIHYTKHHQAYINNFNAIINDNPTLANIPIEKLLLQLPNLPKALQTGLANNAGGTYNHTLFWNIMSPHGGGMPNGTLAEKITATFGSFDAFKERFNTTAKTVFGSGWAWLCMDNNGALIIIPTANQDSPLSLGMQPIIGLDVWEHAYYLLYQNRRPDYINAWWHVINWDRAQEQYDSLVQQHRSTF